MATTPDKSQPRLEGRNGEVYRKHIIYGWTQERCAEHFGISQERVSQIVRDVRAGIPEDSKADLVRASMDLINEVKARALEIADMIPAPVVAGKDGTPVYDPETGMLARDFSGRLRALETALKADDTLAKRLGLDAASKIESTATVRYEVLGVDTENLT